MKFNQIIRIKSTVRFESDMFDEWECSMRFLKLVMQMEAGEYLCWQISHDTEDRIHSVFFSNSNAEKEDFRWIFDKCVSAELSDGKDKDEFFADNRSVYVISSEFKKQEEEPLEEFELKDRNIIANEMWNMLSEAGAEIRIYAAKNEESDLCGAVAISLSDRMSLRLRSAVLEVLSCSDMKMSDLISDIPVIKENDDIWLREFIVKAMQHVSSKNREGGFTKKRGSDSDSAQKDMMRLGIDALNLSVRSYCVLSRAGIDTVGQLTEMSEDELRSVRNLSPKNYREIMEKLAELGIKTEAAIPEKRECLSELNKMIGLSEVKDQIRRITAFAKMNQDMISHGKKTVPMAFHMMFTGNPGTGKTTVARLAAGIFHEIGILPGEGIVEVSRSSLVGKYVGHTAPLIKETFRKARGKVLFIDEAYALVNSDEDSFGNEAVNAIVQEMENDRENTVVIFAGYPDKMQEFMKQNQGLASRIPFTVNFSDYSAEDMKNIIYIEAEKRGFSIHAGAEARIMEICKRAAEIQDSGNGRFARNQIERAILSYADRVYGHEDITESSKTYTLIESDFIIPAETKEERMDNPIGFRLQKSDDIYHSC